MIVVVDDRDIVTEGYASWFGREGITTTGFTPADFDEWVETVPRQDIMAVEAFLIGECATQHRLPARIRERCKAPVIALNDRPSLEHTLELFQSGVDDVVRKPIHVREILARINAIRRRAAGLQRPAPISAPSAFSPMGAIRRSTALIFRCRAVSAAFWNI
jgi:DNA-binding response OmpR family regulator